MTKETRNIRREVLPNGLTIISEEMEHIRSVSIGIWIKTGSREEDSKWNGISHFIEHMVFKGTENRSAEDIARQVDSIGGKHGCIHRERMHLLQHQSSRRTPSDRVGRIERPCNSVQSSSPKTSSGSAV
jgi:hypothetical protein